RLLPTSPGSSGRLDPPGDRRRPLPPLPPVIRLFISKTSCETRRFRGENAETAHQSNEKARPDRRVSYAGIDRTQVQRSSGSYCRLSAGKAPSSRSRHSGLAWPNIGTECVQYRENAKKPPSDRPEGIDLSRGASCRPGRARSHTVRCRTD